MKHTVRAARRQQRARTQPRRRWWWVGGSLLLMVSVGWWWWCALPRPVAQASPVSRASMLQVGMVAPALNLVTAQGNAWSLTQPLRVVVVLAFLQTQPDTADTASRRQAIVLQSMQQQYGAQGVQFAIVDSSWLATGSAPTAATLLNTQYDWHMQAMPLLQDPEGITGQVYGVSLTPTVFLIGADGHVQHRWEGGVGSATLAFALHDVLLP